MKHDRLVSTLACLAILSASAVIGCGAAPPAPATEPGDDVPASAKPIATTEGAPAAAPGEQVIVVTFAAKSESQLAGSATIGAADGGVRVVLELQNVPPGQHGAHFHEIGDCSAPDGASAGGHFNPDGVDHALPDGPGHLGDLGNIEIGDDGTGKLELVVKGANLEPGDPHSLRGRSIIVHALEDDGGQPTGNAGGRIGCAVVPTD